MNALLSPDEIVLALPAALRLVDASDLGDIYDNLDVELVEKTNPSNRCWLKPTRSGRWIAHDLPGLQAAIASNPSVWPANRKDFEVRVYDRAGRFLSSRYEVSLPMAGTRPWGEWGNLPADKITPLVKAGQAVPDYVPLFGAPGRSYRVPVARVAAHLAFRGTDGRDNPASWAMLRVSLGSVTIGLGRADANGNIEAAFAYPDLPAMTAAEATAGRDRISWRINIEVYFGGLASGEISRQEVSSPLLSDLLGQLNGTPKKAFKRLGSTAAFSNPDLVLGERLVLRTESGPNSHHSSLYIEAS